MESFLLPSLGKGISKASAYIYGHKLHEGNEQYFKLITFLASTSYRDSHFSLYLFKICIIWEEGGVKAQTIQFLRQTNNMLSNLSSKQLYPLPISSNTVSFLTKKVSTFLRNTW